MKGWKTLALAAGLTGMSVTTVTLVTTRPDFRGVGPVTLVNQAEPGPFVREESTGLFVGVSRFPHDPSLTVQYAVDDAVDLAHHFALERRVGLVLPRRVVLALSGRPHKEDSRKRLAALRKAGARVEHATAGDILRLLDAQAKRAGDGGLFVAAIASHGFQHDGESYILGSSSTFGDTDSSVRTSRVFDSAALARRSLIFVDACRDRAVAGTRSGSSDPQARAPILRKMTRVQGQVVFFAAAPGEVAYDGDGNGVFTKAVLDGLSCKASTPRGQVIASTLHTYVEDQVLRWVRRKRNANVTRATQVMMEGATRNMPLAQCWLPPGTNTIHVAANRATLTAYDTTTRPLWQNQYEQPILHAEAADLDADAFQEVVVGLRDRILVLNRDGHDLWEKLQEGMTLASFTTADLSRKHTNQIVALWRNAVQSRLTVHDENGSEVCALEHSGQLQFVAVGRPTNMHDPRIAVTSSEASSPTLFLLHPFKLAKGPLWKKNLVAGEITALRIADTNNDKDREIIVSTTRGKTVFSFAGTIVSGRTADWKDVSVRKRRSP